eukprot:TRINITY_DN6268_c0_g1_i1.p1 TRINITY_DN6268_c0_g1~~TRINITY_DN6268_c0_g1_i1.p1  ORF type:complete len:244 (-),score=36.19 TRINITY_DN6268_c0_g1_i1:103-834(-)
MSGRLGDFTPEQEEVFNEIKRRIAELRENEKDLVQEIDLFDDMKLLRFINAREWKVEESYNMIFESLKYRSGFQGIGASNITEDTVPTEIKRNKGYVHKTDNLGNCVSYLLCKNHDSSVDFEELQRFVIFKLDEVSRICSSLYPVDKTTIVFDLTDIGIKNLDFRYLRFFIECLQNHYPNYLQHALVFNAPFIFWGFYQLIKNFIDPKTIKKVHFVSQKDFLNFFPPQNLPTQYGGGSTIGEE